MKIRGRVFKFGHDINTDDIIPARFLNTSERTELARHCMEGVREHFSAEVSKGDIIVGGRNFGCGSSREHAPVSIKAAGISCVIAESFARIFYRNCVNIGLPILECPEAARAVGEGEEIEVDFRDGAIRNVSTRAVYRAFGFPDFMQKIIAAGGLMKMVRASRPHATRKGVS